MSDLSFIANEWNDSVEDDSLRRASVLLRRLLIEDAFGRAWRLVGLPKQPRIQRLAFRPLTDAEWAQAGGGTFRGMAVSAVSMVPRAMSAEEVAARFAAGPPEEEEVWLSVYLTEPCTVSRGTAVDRRKLIQFVCYRLGGVHDDGGGSDMKFDLLDAALNGTIVADKRAPYFELLAMGQNIAASPDVGRFMRAAEAARER